MKVRSRRGSLIRSISMGLYKGTAISSELIARVRDESNRVVYKGVAEADQ